MPPEKSNSPPPPEDETAALHISCVFSPIFGWNAGIGTCPLDESLPIAEISEFLRPVAERAIAFLEHRFQDLPVGYGETNYAKDLGLVKKGGEKLNEWVQSECTKFIKNNQKVGIVGGDHSVPLGFFNALASFHDEFGI